MMNKPIFILVVIFTVFWNAKSSILPELLEYQEDDPYAESYSQQGPITYRDTRDPEYLQDYEQEQDEQPIVEEKRVARQKDTCKWTGCHKLPIGKHKDTICPSGTFLESYKMCDPRGSGNVNVQCCP